LLLLINTALRTAYAIHRGKRRPVKTETVASQIPRTGSLFCKLLSAMGCLATGGSGVTSETGGLEAQLASNSAVAINTLAFLIFVNGNKRRERLMGYSSISGCRLEAHFRLITG
jgi:hypothetical protein